MLYHLNQALELNNQAITLLSEEMIPTVISFDKYLARTDTIAHHQSKSLFKSLLTKSVDKLAQAKGTRNYINVALNEIRRKAEALPAVMPSTRKEYLDRSSDFWFDYESKRIAQIAQIEASMHDKVNDALQSNFQSLVQLADDLNVGLTVQVLKLESFFKDEPDANTQAFVNDILRMSLEITTYTIQTGRQINSRLNPKASVHTKKVGNKAKANA